MRIAIILNLFVISISLQAQVLNKEECTNTDIQKTNPEMKDYFSTPKDQGIIGWCYAFVATDLLSAKAKIPLSSLHTSINYNYKVRKNPLRRWYYKSKTKNLDHSFNEVYEYGSVKTALKLMVKNKKICSEKDLPYYQVFSDEIYYLIKNLDQLKELRADKQISEEVACTKVQESLQIFDTDTEDLKKLSIYFLENDLNLAFNKLVDHVCKDKEIPLQKYKIRTLKTPKVSKKIKKYFSQINKVLDSGNPIGISYDTKYISPDPGSHSSTVIGRRWNNNKCEYKIRNSWGSTCDQYKKEIQCNQEEGSYWISDSLYQEMVIQSIYLD